MKKNLFIVKILSIVVFIFVSSVASATTGGPATIYSLRYDAISNNVYYLSLSQDGRGCPPILEKLSLLTGEYSTVFSCDDAENMANIDKDYTYGAFKQKIFSATEKFDFPKLINLKANKISIETKIEKIKPCSSERPWECGVDLVATVAQNGIKKAEIPFSMCSKDEPLTIDAYSLGNSSDNIILMFSRIGLCIEGGYTLETIHPVSQINITDTSNINYSKPSSALIPHVGSLFIMPEEELEKPNQIDKNEIQQASSSINTNLEDNLYQNISFVLFGIILVGVGVILGRSFKK